MTHDNGNTRPGTFDADTPAPADTRAQRGRWIVLTAVSLGLLLATIDTSILYIAVPVLEDALGASTSESLWIINMYPLVMTGLLLGTGTLGDRYGHKRVFLLGIALFGLASLIAAFSPTPGILIFSRALLAIGAALMLPATLAIIRITFDDERERNIAIAVWSSVSIGGIAFGPLVGGLLLEWFWWGSVFLINVPIVIVTFILTAIFAPKAAEESAVPWDLVSSIWALMGLTGLVATIKEIASTSPSATIIGISLVAALAGFALFVTRQRRLDTPLLDFTIFRNAAVSAGVLAAGLSTFVFAGIGAVTSLYFQTAAGYTPLQAGLLVGCIAVGATITSLASGSLLTRIGPRALLLVAAVLAGLGYGLATLTLNTHITWLGLSLFVAGTGIGVLITVASSTIITNVAPERAGMASAVEEVSYEFGSLLSVTVLGSIYTTITALSTSGTDGYRAVLLIVIGACAAALAGLAVLLRKTPTLNAAPH
ncbi:MFS transporter [Corynebacterium appendicis]|uniref:MFS transporter n=1 Tax=Corynebacterium appendicis TaxID=163202 RepID=UPI00254A42E5|nr:MFS transporter [Corynebacterium appendicis]MDK8624920.1 MFS transporter [Corynebacterium appendicis]